MTTDAHTENEVSVSIKHLDAVHEGLALIVNDLELDGDAVEAVKDALKTALERGGASLAPHPRKDLKVSWVNLADKISEVGMEAFMAEGNLPVEMAFATKPQVLCDVIYRICSLAKVETTPENLQKLDQTLKGLFEGAPPPHVVKTLEGEIKSLKKANERLQSLVKGNDPVELMDDGEKFETLRDEAVHDMAKSTALIKAEWAGQAEREHKLQAQIHSLQIYLSDLKDGMAKLQGAQRLDIIASLKEVLGIVEGTSPEGKDDGPDV